ncbi:unnamed protein product [Adineta ricciae]|uniref:Death domain-containing protein n=1 Tax=Adineta ricciae TaxID=249248 RepID=A0A814ZJ73_ADIRI|nr:unnamed protein product [Adineta ricciae]
MPARPTSGKAGGKKDSAGGKKGKNKAAKPGVADPHQEQIDGLVREREEIRSKLNLVCTKIMENVNLDDYKNDIDLNKQQPSDIPIDIIYSMIDQICYYRVAFLNLFQETEDNEKISVQKKITQLSIDDPDLFRKQLTAYQRLTFVARERDVWKENAGLLHDMYKTIVDQVEMETFKRPSAQAEEILKNSRLNLEDICFIFSLPRILSINDAQKLRAKKPSSASQDQNASPDQTQHADMSDDPTLRSQLSSQHERRNHSASGIKRTVSFADDFTLQQDNGQTDAQSHTELPPIDTSDERILEENLVPTSSVNSSTMVAPHHQYPIDERFIDSDYHSSSSSSFHHHRPQSKYNLPSKYHRPSGKEVLVKKMDPNLRMLIIKELSKSGHAERPLSRMSSTRGLSNSNSFTPRHQHQQQMKVISFPEWVELARLVGIDEPEIEHWLSQNLQYPAGRVISSWCNCESNQPTVADLHSLVTSNELNRHDLGRYIETMYIIE